MYKRQSLIVDAAINRVDYLTRHPSHFDIHAYTTAGMVNFLSTSLSSYPTIFGAPLAWEDSRIWVALSKAVIDA